MSAADYQAMIKTPKRQGRYGRNKRIKTEDGNFDSKGEHARWNHLNLMQQHGMICELKRQIPYPFEHGGVLICTYNADHEYRVTDTGEYVVEDYKGKVITPEFTIKRKLMKAFYGIDLRIVRTPKAEV